MRIPTVRLLICLGVSGLAAGCASTGSTSSSSGPKLSEIDKAFISGISSYDENRDRVVTCEEWRKAAADAFAKANTSRSGFLNKDEARNLALTDRTFVVATFDYYDVNRDGKVDKKEFVERPNPAFTYVDKDTDCRLNETELLAARNLVAPSAAPEPRRSAVGNGGPPNSGGGY